MIRSFAFAASLLVAAPVLAADLGVKKPTPVAPVSAACKETKALPADAFGFATGSDVADLGSWGIALDTAASNGLRGGTTYNVSPVVQVSGSFFPCFEVGPFVTLGYTHSKAYNTGTVTRTTSIGGGVEMKYKLLGRATHGVGLTFAVTPSFGNTDVSPGANSGFFGNSFRLLADAELIKGKLYGALNVELFQNWTDSTPFAKASTFAVRGALTTPVTDALYVGGELSYQRAYTGAWLNNYQAYAVYIGPTFFWQINDKFTLNGTWAYQVAGDGKTNPTRALGIDNFSRHLARLKLGYAF